MGYLTEEQINTYCTMPGVTMQIVESASLLIDAYKGKSFMEQKNTEQVKLNKKRTPYGDIYKGKLKHLPRVEVTGISAKIPSPFGGFTDSVYSPECLMFDSDDEPYFTFVPQQNTHSIFASQIPYTVTVSYTSGYTQDTIPEQIKRATGLLCDNLKRNGGTLKWLSREDFDIRLTLADDGIFPREIKQIVDLVRLS